MYAEYNGPLWPFVLIGILFFLAINNHTYFESYPCDSNGEVTFYHGGWTDDGDMINLELGPGKCTVVLKSFDTFTFAHEIVIPVMDGLSIPPTKPGQNRPCMTPTLQERDGDKYWVFGSGCVGELIWGEPSWRVFYLETDRPLNVTARFREPQGLINRPALAHSSQR